MKKTLLITLILFSHFSFCQKITVSQENTIAKMELDNAPQISGYEVKDNVLKVYGLSTVKGRFPIGVKILDDLLRSSKNVEGSPLLIENEIDLNDLSLKGTTANTIISYYSKEGFTVNNKSKVPQSKIEKVELVREFNNSNAFPIGKIKTKNLDGEYKVDLTSGLPKFVPTPPDEKEPAPKDTEKYNPIFVSGIKDKSNKVAGKLNFEVKKFGGDLVDKLAFKTAKDFQNSYNVTDINNKYKGKLLVFKNENVKEVEYNDANLNNVTLCFYDEEFNKKFNLEIPTDVPSKWVTVESVVEENGQLTVVLSLIASMLKGETYSYRINQDGSIKKVSENLGSVDKVINIKTKGSEVMVGDKYEYVKTIKNETNYAQIFEVYGKRSDADFKEMNTASRKGELVKIFDKECTLIKQYFNPASAELSEYTYPIGGNSVIKSSGDTDYLLQLTKNDFVVAQITPKDFKRPNTIVKYNSIAETNDKMYFVYANKDKDFVVVTVDK